MKQSWPYLVIVIALFLGINGPTLFSEGMFMDGLFYSTISRNLAEGKGSFWDLYYTETYNYHFYGHPPLSMGMESLFYRIFGDHIFVEHIYSLAMFIISSVLIVRIWFLLVYEDYKNLFWLPLLFHSIIGVVGWSVSNNILENTMTLFVLLSFYLFLKSLSIDRIFIRLSIVFISGIALLLAFFTKGAVGLFPLCSFVFLFIFTKKIKLKRAIIDTLIMTMGLLFPLFLVLFFFTDARVYLTNYYEAQILHSLTKVNIISSRYWIIWSLFQQLIIILIITSTVFLIGKNKFKIKLKSNKKFWFLIAVGLSGVLPMIISLKQRDFYIVSAYPFFALGLAYLIKDHLKVILNKIEQKPIYIKTVKTISLSLLFVSLIIVGLQKNRIGRDVEMIKDIKEISKKIPKESIIIIPPKLSQDWALRGYFARYHSVGLTFDFKDYNYYISDSEVEIEGFELVENLDLSKYYLYTNLIK